MGKKKNNEETTKIPVDQPVSQEDTKAIKKSRKNRIDGKPRYVRAVLYGLLLVLVATLISGAFGYGKAIRERKAEEEAQRLNAATTHYMYGMEALAAGSYEVARLQFEYVIKIYPTFPDITEKYTEAVINLTKQTEVVPQGPTATPTRDIQGVQALFAQAQVDMADGEWCLAVDALNGLRDEDLYYEALTVDGMLWISLRNCAVKKLTTEGDLEEGLYYLSLVEKYAPLDKDAVAYATWARMYVTGASYWAVDWQQVVNFFSKVYTAFPYLHDGTGWTAIERYRVGLKEYGNYLMQRKEYCEAEQQFRASLNVQHDDEVFRLADEAYLLCLGPTNTPAPLPTETLEVTPTPEESPTPDGGGGGDTGGGEGGAGD